MGTRSWLNKQIQSEIIPAIAYLNNTPQGRKKAQSLTQDLRDGWAKRGFTEPVQQKPLFDALRRVIRAKFGDDHFSLDFFKLSRDEHFAINQQNQSNARDRQIHQQYLDNPDVTSHAERRSSHAKRRAELEPRSQAGQALEQYFARA